MSTCHAQLRQDVRHNSGIMDADANQCEHVLSPVVATAFRLLRHFLLSCLVLCVAHVCLVFAALLPFIRHPLRFTTTTFSQPCTHKRHPHPTPTPPPPLDYHCLHCHHKQMCRRPTAARIVVMEHLVRSSATGSSPRWTSCAYIPTLSTPHHSNLVTHTAPPHPTTSPRVLSHCSSSQPGAHASVELTAQQEQADRGRPTLTTT